MEGPHHKVIEYWGTETYLIFCSRWLPIWQFPLLLPTKVLTLWNSVVFRLHCLQKNVCQRVGLVWKFYIFRRSTLQFQNVKEQSQIFQQVSDVFLKSAQQYICICQTPCCRSASGWFSKNFDIHSLLVKMVKVR